MAGKLDQSLEEIVKDRRQTIRPRGRRVGKPTAASTRPSGGVTKATKATKATKVAKGAIKNSQPIVPVAESGESKVIVSSLPTDVTEQQIKEYFGKMIGVVKRVLLTYGPNGQSRGVATIIFKDPGSAVEAARQMNGVKIDNRPMKVEVIIGANQAPVPVAAKGLGDRITSTKVGAKTQSKVTANARAGKSAQGAQAGRRRGVRGRTEGRPKPKSTEELDAEMTDYFGDGGANGDVNSGTATTNGAAQPVTNGGDTGMEDEIM